MKTILNLAGATAVALAALLSAQSASADTKQSPPVGSFHDNFKKGCLDSGGMFVEGGATIQCGYSGGTTSCASDGKSQCTFTPTSSKGAAVRGTVGKFPSTAAPVKAR